MHFIFKHKSRTKNTISQKFGVPPIINDYSLVRQKSHCHSYNLLKLLNRYRSSAKQKVKPFCKALLLTNIFCSFNTTCVELPGDRISDGALAKLLWCLWFHGQFEMSKCSTNSQKWCWYLSHYHRREEDKICPQFVT